MKLLILIFLPITVFAQNWTEPVNISYDMSILDNQPDLCIDKNGRLHCVFTHKLDNNWRKIYYSQSTDYGFSWIIPEDISLNTDLSLLNPHVKADSNNNIYVSWDYNTGNPEQTQIYIKKYNGTYWEEAVNITPNEPESHGNALVIDNNNRLYCFWGKGGYNSNTYYKYLENDKWSETICPYPGNHYWAFTDFAVDDFNNIHCIGMYHNEGQPHEEDRIIYFKYEYDSFWAEKTFLTTRTEWLYGNGIDTDTNNFPHIAYRRKDPYSTGTNDDSTMYSFFNGSTWNEPELVVNDPAEQHIVIDSYNRVHIFDREKLDVGYKLVHYQKIGNNWQGFIIDTSEIVVGNPDIIEADNVLYLTYYKCFSDTDCKIRFTKLDLQTNIFNIPELVEEIKIYPNPFRIQSTIEFKTTIESHIDVSIYNLMGQPIKTLLNKNIQAGEFRLIWNGKDNFGKEVSSGLYLVRLKSGRNILTKPVELIK